MKALYENWEQTGMLLAEKLKQYENSNAIVVGVSGGGVFMAATIAEELGLALGVISCRAIYDPTDKSKTLGSVSINETVIHFPGSDIPHDYIYRQQILLQDELRHEMEFYYNDLRPFNYQYKTVIVVTDIISTADSLLAGLREIKKERPLKIIVATAVIDARTAIVLGAEIDELLFLHMNKGIISDQCFEDTPEIDKKAIRKLIGDSKKGLELH